MQCYGLRYQMFEKYLATDLKVVLMTLDKLETSDLSTHQVLNKLIHHLVGVVRARSQPQSLLAPRDSRVVDSLK